MPTEKRVLAAVTSYSGVSPKPFINLMCLSQETGKAELRGEYSVRWMVGGPKVKIHVARNLACRTALGMGASHLAFIDDDMLIQTMNIFGKLLDDGCHIVAPLFFRSEEPYDPLVFKMGPDGLPCPILDYPQGTLFKVDGGVGTGFMLIETRVLNQMSDPWFYYPKDMRWSMDLNFCQNAMKLAFSVFCDSRIKLGQMGSSYPIGEEQFQGYSKSLEQKALTLK